MFKAGETPRVFQHHEQRLDFTPRLQQEISGFHICSRDDASSLCSLASLMSRDVLFGLMIHGLGCLVTPKRLTPYLQSFVVGNTKTTAVPAVYRHAGGCAEGKCKTILVNIA